MYIDSVSLSQQKIRTCSLIVANVHITNKQLFFNTTVTVISVKPLQIIDLFAQRREFMICTMYSTVLCKLKCNDSTTKWNDLMQSDGHKGSSCLVRDPLVWYRHEVPLHSEGEALEVLRRLDDGRCSLSCDHRNRFTHPFHLLDKVVLKGEQ